jgi:hypothetical protein
MPSLDVWLESWVDAMKRGKTMDKYYCYNPVNLQVSRVGRFKNPTIDLPQHFGVVGIMEDLFRSTCLISISLEHHVPPRCNCSLGSASTTVFHPNDHGVHHHGGTFQTTPQQDHWIQALTPLDQQLYDDVRLLFLKQVETTEQQFNFSMCDNTFT